MSLFHDSHEKILNCRISPRKHRFISTPPVSTFSQLGPEAIHYYDERSKDQHNDEDNGQVKLIVLVEFVFGGVIPGDVGVGLPGVPVSAFEKLSHGAKRRLKIEFSFFLRVGPEHG